MPSDWRSCKSRQKLCANDLDCPSPHRPVVGHLNPRCGTLRYVHWRTGSGCWRGACPKRTEHPQPRHRPSQRPNIQFEAGCRIEDSWSAIVKHGGGDQAIHRSSATVGNPVQVPSHGDLTGHSAGDDPDDGDVGRFGPFQAQGRYTVHFSIDRVSCFKEGLMIRMPRHLARESPISPFS